MKNNSNRYEEIKAALKAELGESYPKNTNGLSDKFICQTFAAKLELDDIIAIDAKRDACKASKEKGNWFPAFRSWVGQTYFPEFGKKKSSKKLEDTNGDSLKKLIASRKANS